MLKFIVILIIPIMLFTCSTPAIPQTGVDDNPSVQLIGTQVFSSPNDRYKTLPPVPIPANQYKLWGAKGQGIETVPMDKFPAGDRLLCVGLLFSNPSTARQKCTLENVFLVLDGKDIPCWEKVPAMDFASSPLRMVVDWYRRFPDARPNKNSPPPLRSDKQFFCISFFD